MEPLMFSLWSRVAPRPDPRLVEGLIGVEPYTFEAGDGTSLRGYLIRARNGRGELIDGAAGAVVVAPGNAMTATHLVAEFVFLSTFGYDVYILDYRGYGGSQGRRRLLAFTVDYEELVRHLAAEYPRVDALGLSLGGIVILKALDAGAPIGRAVVDSSPSTLRQFLCPPSFDPVDNLPDDASHLLVVTGGRDRVIPPAASAELVDEARERGARTIFCARCDHPLMDRDPGLRAARMRAYARFFVGGDVAWSETFGSETPCLPAYRCSGHGQTGRNRLHRTRAGPGHPGCVSRFKAGRQHAASR